MMSVVVIVIAEMVKALAIDQCGGSGDLMESRKWWGGVSGMKLLFTDHNGFIGGIIICQSKWWQR